MVGDAQRHQRQAALLHDVAGAPVLVVDAKPLRVGTWRDDDRRGFAQGIHGSRRSCVGAQSVGHPGHGGNPSPRVDRSLVDEIDQLQEIGFPARLPRAPRKASATICPRAA